MNSIADGSVIIQTSSQSVLSTPSWFGEATLIVEHLRKQGVLSAISERVRFARRRFGHYEVIDFLAVLFGYAISGERTLEAFYEGLQPFASTFMALFDRDQLPARSTLSRFLTALRQEPVEALRSLFLDDLLSRPLSKERQTGGLVDREGGARVVFDIDGTREAARQRALPQTEELPPAYRRLDQVCAAGYTGRKRGEVVRTRTVVSQAHSYQWLGTVGNPGNGLYREELRQALWAIGRYLATYHLPHERARLAARWAIWHRSRAGGSSGLLVRDARAVTTPCWIIHSSRRVCTCPQISFSIVLKASWCAASTTAPLVPVGPAGVPCRVVVATHPAGTQKSRVGLTRSGVVYELFFTDLPPHAFTVSDVVELYLHRGAFEPALADEDAEQDPDRWCSQSPSGQECWQIVSQWVWNEAPGTGASAGANPHAHHRVCSCHPACQRAGYRLACSRVWLWPTRHRHPPRKAGRFSGKDFSLQPDGTLRCPAGKTLHPTEQRTEHDGSLRVLYAARIGDCRACSLREQCQWHGRETTKPRRVSLLLHPLPVGSAPLLWQDWSRREQRRACMHLLRRQRVDTTLEQALSPPVPPSPIFSRAQRAHSRLSFAERLARNASAPTAGRITIQQIARA